MYLTTHAAVGVLISQSVERPLWVFLFSFLSHFVLDFIPHGDEDVGTWIQKRPRNAFVVGLLDLGLLTMFLSILYATKDLPQMALISAGVIGAVLPDFLTNIFPLLHERMSWMAVVRLVYHTQRRLGLRTIWRGHDWFHRLSHTASHRRITIKQGLVMQIVILVVALWLGLGYR